MTGRAQLKKASDGSVVPYSKITVKQTWGREIPTVTFTTRPTVALVDNEALELYRDNTLLMKFISELVETTSGPKTYTGRLNPVLPFFRILQPSIFQTDPAWLLQLLNQPVGNRLLPYRISVFEPVNKFSRMLANWKNRGNYGVTALFKGTPFDSSIVHVGNSFIGITSDGHEENGVGVACLGNYSGTEGSWLLYETAIGHPQNADAQTIAVRFKAMKEARNIVAVGLFNGQFSSSAPMAGYILSLDLDGTSGNLVLYRVPNITPGNWVSIATASIDLTQFFDKYMILKFSRRNRGTIAAPHYFFRGGVVKADGSNIGQINETEDNTYSVYYHGVGCRGGGSVGQVGHIHVDRLSLFATDQINADFGSVADIQPWNFASTNVGGNLGFGSDDLDELGDDRGATVFATSANQALNDLLRIDMAASKADLCRVDLLAHDGEYAQNIEIAVSNDASGTPTNWTTVWSRTSNLARDIHAIFTPVTARHVRAKITANGSQKWSIREFRIYQKAGVPIFNVGTITDYGLGVVFDENWITLWGAMHDVADATGWHVWINPRTLEVNFNATRGTDLSSTIKFEEGRNIGQFKHQRNLLERIDKVWVLGAKLGEEQLYATAEVASLPSDYRERVFIASAITDETILQTLATKLKDVLSSALEILNLTVKDNYASAAWDVGDLVAVSYPSKGINSTYRVLNVTRTYQGKSELVTVDLASQAVIALQTLEQILAQDNVLAQMLLQSKIRDLQTS